MIRYTTIPKRLIKRDFSKTSLVLFKNLGIHTSSEPTLKLVKCIEYNKRVLPVNNFAQLIARVYPEWDKLTLSEKWYLLNKEVNRFEIYVNAEIPDMWDYFIYRDKESVKVSQFMLKKKEKRVTWSNSLQFSVELEMTKSLTQHSVSVIPFVRVEPATYSAVQHLIDTIPIEPNEIEKVFADLSTYYISTAKLSDYNTQLSGYYDDLKDLNRNIDFNFSNYEQNLLKKVPVTQVHGDLSPHNIIWNGINYYLIDFDRSFQANVFYDFTYFNLQDKSTSNKIAKRALIELFNRFYPETKLTDIEIHSFILKLFIVDNLRYLKLTQNDKNISIFTKLLIKNGIQEWLKL